MMTKILVIGATGYVASAFALFAVKQGHQVAGFSQPSANITAVSHCYNLGVTKGNSLDKDEIIKAAKGFDVIVNTVALVTVDAKFVDHERIELGTLKAVLAAIEHLDIKAVWVSSITGMATLSMSIKAENIMKKEDHLAGLPLGPKSFWGASTEYCLGKHTFEKFLEDYHTQHPTTKICIVAPGFVYGPSTSVGFVNGVIREALKGNFLFDDCACPFIHVDDVSRTILAAVHQGEPGKKYGATGENTHLYVVIEKIAKILKIDIKPPPKSMEKILWDESKTLDELSLPPRIPVDEGIVGTAAYIKTLL